MNVYFVFGMRGFGHEFTNGETNAARNIEHFFYFIQMAVYISTNDQVAFRFKKPNIRLKFMSDKNDRSAIFGIIEKVN